MDNMWIVADTHFGHADILKYCNRPFGSVEEMDERLVENWNSVVGPEDIVVHLGDFAFGDKERIRSIFSRLNGRIDLVMGNHDVLDVKDYYDIGFCRVYDRPVVYRDFFIMSHAPLQWVGNGGVYANIYGHVHNMEVYNTWTRNSCCACIERHDYRPISFNTIKGIFLEMRLNRDRAE